MRVPAAVYRPSPRPYRGLGYLDYPLHDGATTVTHCGRICFKNLKVKFKKGAIGAKLRRQRVEIASRI